MKKIILSSLFLYSLLYCASVSATTYYGPGSSGNPINVQIIPTPVSLDTLKAQYGLTDYYDCYANYPLYRGSAIDSDPTTYQGRLNAIKSCLEMTALYRERNKSNDSVDDIACSSTHPNTVVVISDGKKMCECKTGYGWNEQKTGCIAADLVCGKAYSNSVSIIIDGKTKCGCKSGYVWNDQGTSCVVAPIVPEKTNDQICQDSYGLKSNWDGTKTDGKLNCECAIGYVWNEQKASCESVVKNFKIRLPNNQISIIDGPRDKTNENICINACANCVWDGNNTILGGPPLTCICASGYTWDNQQKSCIDPRAISVKINDKGITIPKTETPIIMKNDVLETKNTKNIDTPKTEIEVTDNKATISTETMKPKSFWARIMGWLGLSKNK